jgi:hypothetical protein
VNYLRHFLWTWLGLLAFYSIWMFGHGVYIDMTCFWPGQHWSWWLWRGYVIWIVVPWVVTGILGLVVWLYRRFA